MAATLLEIHPDNPDKRKIEQVAKALEDGAVVIYPTRSEERRVGKEC